jgi:hypothetical protein
LRPAKSETSAAVLRLTRTGVHVARSRGLASAIMMTPVRFVAPSMRRWAVVRGSYGRPQNRLVDAVLALCCARRSVAVDDMGRGRRTGRWIVPPGESRVAAAHRIPSRRSRLRDYAQKPPAIWWLRYRAPALRRNPQIRFLDVQAVAFGPNRTWVLPALGSAFEAVPSDAPANRDGPDWRAPSRGRAQPSKQSVPTHLATNLAVREGSHGDGPSTVSARQPACILIHIKIRPGRRFWAPGNRDGKHDESRGHYAPQGALG